jgi:glycosyltransferase involved in cell wall biosynthesis
MSKLCFLADGTSIHTVRWCKYFSELGHEVHLITLQKAEIENIQIHFIDCGDISKSGGNWKVLTKIGEVKRIIKKIQPELLHSLYATSYGILGAFSGFHPFVVTALGSDVLISPTNSKIYQFLLKYVFSKAQWITAMSDPMREIMIKLGAKAELTTTLIFGIDTSIFNDLNKSISSTEFVITSTRNFEPVYNIDILIDALSICQSKISNLRVNIIGSGRMELQLKEKIQTLGLTEKINFVGKLTQTEIASYLNKSHLFVSVSSSDGNNISLNEAMACGCVNVVSDIPANRQWIIEEENGFYCSDITAESIANTILIAYQKFENTFEKANQLNKKLISELADWNINMKKVEKKYNQLIQ